jgi:hypothetical protein
MSNIILQINSLSKKVRDNFSEWSTMTIDMI